MDLLKSRKKVAIIGSGLAGLACGTKLTESDSFDVVFYEKSKKVGGRVSTSLANGYVLDEGFQVSLAAYPNFKEFIGSLKTRSLARGATFVIDNKRIEVDLSARGLFSLLINWTKIGNISDFFGLIRLLWINVPNINTSLDLIERVGFSKKFKRNFLFPFFRGVLNSKSIETDADYFKFLVKMFTLGPAVVPKEGMSQIPKAMYERLLQKSHVKFNFDVTVTAINSGSIRLSSGDEKKYDYVVCACDPWCLEKIEGARKSTGNSHQKSPLTTFYVKTKGVVYNSRSLVLPAGNYKIKHSPYGYLYKSTGPYLSINVLDVETSFETVRDELCQIYNTDRNSFELIDIKKVIHVLSESFSSRSALICPRQCVLLWRLYGDTID